MTDKPKEQKRPTSAKETAASKMKGLLLKFANFMSKNSEGFSSDEEMEVVVNKMALVGLMDSIKTYADAAKQLIAIPDVTGANAQLIMIYMNAMLNAMAVSESLLLKKEMIEQKSLVQRAIRAKKAADNGGDRDSQEQQDEEATEELSFEEDSYESDPTDDSDKEIIVSSKQMDVFDFSSFKGAKKGGKPS
jgi:hypothetical protein